MPEYPRFSDFADSSEGYPLEGKKVKIGDILNTEVLITAYKISPSKKNAGKCLTMQFDNGDEQQVIFTGSEVLMNQLERHKDKLPFLTKIVKHDKYFTLS